MKDRAPLPRCVGFSLIDKAGPATQIASPAFLCLSPFYGQKSNIKRGKSLLEMLATILQMPKRFFFACKIVANAKTFFFRLQDCCKRQKVLFPICKIVASAANYFFRFARVLQAFPKTDKPLQKGMNSGKQRLAEAQQAFIKSGSGRMDLGAFLPPLWEMNSRQRSRDDGFFSFGWCACSYAPMVGAVLPVRRLTP